MTQTMFSCSGWQNVTEKMKLGQPIQVRQIEVPAEHAHPEMSFTSARHFSVNELIKSLAKEAGVKAHKIKIEFQH